MIGGDKIEDYCSCDSEYMGNIMPKIAVAMRENFHWIPKEKNYI